MVELRTDGQTQAQGTQDDIPLLQGECHGDLNKEIKSVRNDGLES